MTNRVQQLLDAIEGQLKAARDDGRPLFTGVKIQLDPYDLTDVMRESFVAPAARVLLTTAKPEFRPRGACDLDCTVTIAVITKTTTAAGADAAGLDLILRVAQLVNDDPYFGLTSKTKAASLDGIRVAVSEAANTKRLAIVLLLVKVCLLDVITARDAVAIATGLREGKPVTTLVINDVQEVLEP